MSPEKHCTYCGAEHVEAGWPRRCAGCERTTWRNPTPVAVVLLPVHNGGDPQGLVVIRRGIEPRRGQLALPGGYVDWEESWQTAGAREVREETGYPLDPGSLTAFDVLSPPDGRTVLIFGVAEPIARADLPEFSGTNETSERAVIEAPAPLAFPLHTHAVATWFARQRAEG